MGGKPKKWISGFTVIELVMAIVVMTVVSVTAVPILQNQPRTQAQYAIYKVRSDLRYAQMTAIQTQLRTRVVFNSAAESYDLEIETSPGTWVALAEPNAGQNYSVTFPSDADFPNVDISDVDLNNLNTVIFDSVGAPFDANDTALTEPAYMELNSIYRIEFQRQTGNMLITVVGGGGGPCGG
ncbi:MAG: hypothetical protein Q8R76_12690 [Candidatus Omnitrophota bacterium]|nr:hypothetical protein [Candidatus Omnitrophota bacterium]